MVPLPNTELCTLPLVDIGVCVVLPLASLPALPYTELCKNYRLVVLACHEHMFVSVYDLKPLVPGLPAGASRFRVRNTVLVRLYL